MVLLLAANPRGTELLDLAREVTEVQRELAPLAATTGLRFEARWAVSVDDAMRHMTEIDPCILHLSGHGRAGATVVLEGDRGEPQPVTARALAMMISAAGRHVRAVVASTCFGLADAEELLTAVDCVIGFEGRVSDVAARAFSVRFYAALAAGRSIGNAVAHGAATLFARQLVGAALPRCLTRDGVDADAMTIVRRARSDAGPRGQAP